MPRKGAWVSKDRVMQTACMEAKTFARKFRSLDDAWVACKNPSWLSWYVTNLLQNARSPRAVAFANGIWGIANSSATDVMTSEERVRLIRRFLPRAPKRSDFTKGGGR